VVLLERHVQLTAYSGYECGIGVRCDIDKLMQDMVDETRLRGGDEECCANTSRDCTYQDQYGIIMPG